MSSRDLSPYRLDNVRSAIAHYLLGRGAGAIAGLASTVLLVRYMVLTDYAGYTAVMGIAGIVSMFASLGLERALTRFIPEGRLNQNVYRLGSLIWRLFTIRILSTVLVTLLLMTVWPWVVQLFDFMSLHEMPLAFAIYLLAFGTYQMLASVLQALVRQKLLTQITVVQWGGRLVWIIVLVQQGATVSLHQALWIMALPQAAGTAILLLAVFLAIRPSPNAQSESEGTEASWPTWPLVRHLAAHSYSFNILASLPQGYFMRTLVAATMPVDIVAAYGFFSSIADRLKLYLPIQLMYNLVEPVMVARYLQSRNISVLVSNAQLMYKANILILAAALVVVLICGPEMTGFLTNGRFVDQSWILALLLIQLIVGSHILSMQLILTVLKANQILTKAALYALLMILVYLAGVIVLDNPLLILFGVLVYSTSINTFTIVMMRKQSIPYEVRFREIIVTSSLVILVASLMNILIARLSVSGLISTVVSTLFGTGLFVFLSILANPLSSQERSSLLGVLRKRSSNTVSK